LELVVAVNLFWWYELSMSAINQRLDKKTISVLMVLVFILRWLASMLVGFLIYNLFKTDSEPEVLVTNEAVETFALFEESITNSVLSGGPAWEVFVFLIAMSAGFITNVIISGIAIRKLALPENRLWAFATLVLVPCVVIAIIATIAPVIDPLSRNVMFELSAIIDFFAVLIITWRMCINKSPFDKLNLVDSSEPIYADPSYPGF